MRVPVSLINVREEGEGGSRPGHRRVRAQLHRAALRWQPIPSHTDTQPAGSHIYIYIYIYMYIYIYIYICIYIWRRHTFDYALASTAKYYYYS